MDADTNICAVILNYNDAQTTMKLTESWKNSKVIRNIIIVDNCSILGKVVGLFRFDIH